MDNPTHISILGGGLAGLAVGYYAKKNGIPFTIYEARNRLGGDCITLKKEGFLFDSGAHRLHDQDPEITQEMRNLLGDALQRVDIPSKIYAQGKFLHFPLSLTGLLENLGLFTIVKAAVEVGISRLAKRNLNKSFESFAVYAYGSDIAERFLLNYSEKLWGAPCARLSSTIAGKRLQGITAKSLMAGIFLGRKAMDKHVEGAFHYPKMGIGVIAEKLGEFCGEKTIVKDAKITKILHDDGRIRAIEVNGKKEIATDEVVSTLSLPFFLHALKPPPPRDILDLAETFRYRQLILVALFLDKESINNAATIYFPDRSLPFTRAYEPKNRCSSMSPPGKTSLIVEIPCQQEDSLWSCDDDTVIQIVRSHFLQLGWIEETEILDASVTRLYDAYPILELGCEERLEAVFEYLRHFSNLKISGRMGKFVYAWIHDMIRLGKEIIEEYIRK